MATISFFAANKVSMQGGRGNSPSIKTAVQEVEAGCGLSQQLVAEFWACCCGVAPLLEGFWGCSALLLCAVRSEQAAKWGTWTGLSSCGALSAAHHVPEQHSLHLPDAQHKGMALGVVCLLRIR